MMDSMSLWLYIMKILLRKQKSVRLTKTWTYENMTVEKSEEDPFVGDKILLIVFF